MLGKFLEGLFSAKPSDVRPEPPTRTWVDQKNESEGLKERQLVARRTTYRNQISRAMGKLNGLNDDISRLSGKMQVGGGNETGLGLVLQSRVNERNRLAKYITDTRARGETEIAGLKADLAEMRASHHNQVHALANGPNMDIAAEPTQQLYLSTESMDRAFSGHRHALTMDKSDFEIFDLGGDGAPTIVSEEMQQAPGNLSHQEKIRMGLKTENYFDSELKELRLSVRNLGLARKRAIKSYYSNEDEELKKFIESEDGRFHAITNQLKMLDRVQHRASNLGPDRGLPSWVPVPLTRYPKDVVSRDDHTYFPMQGKKAPLDLPTRDQKLGQFVGNMKRVREAADTLAKRYQTETWKSGNRTDGLPIDCNDVLAVDRMDEDEEKAGERPMTSSFNVYSTPGQRGQPPPWRSGRLPQDVHRQQDENLVTLVSLQGSGADRSGPLGRPPISEGED